MVVLPGDLTIEPRPDVGSDLPSPVSPGSSLWAEAEAQVQQAVALLNAQNRSLGSPVLLRAWSHVGRASRALAGFKLCLRVPVAGEERHIRVDTAPVEPGAIGSERHIAVVASDLAPPRVGELAASNELFPCPGRGYAGHTLGRAYQRVLNAKPLPSASLLAKPRVLNAKAQATVHVSRDATVTPPPTSFNTRAAFPQCAGPVGQQGSCGASYAFAVAGMASERLCIARPQSDKRALEARLTAAEAAFNASVAEIARVRQELREMALLQWPRKLVELSVQELLSCASARRASVTPAFCTLGPDGQQLDRYALGCEGGSLLGALQYVHEYGLPRASCAPYRAEKLAHKVQWSAVEVCSSLESSACHAERGLFKLGAPHRLRSEDEILQALLGGPVVAEMGIFADFGNTYPDGTVDGIYVVQDAPRLGTATVLLHGWGMSEGGVPYWLGRNSWGTDWGVGGFFKIRRGTNEAGIESQVFSSEPPRAGGCVQVLPQPDSCTLVNVCPSTRRVEVGYVGGRRNCGSWVARLTLLPGHAHAQTLPDAHLCDVEVDRFERTFSGSTTYLDRTSAYTEPGTQPSCVLEATVAGQARCCGNQCASAPVGKVASFPTRFCPAGCAEAGGEVYEQDLA